MLFMGIDPGKAGGVSIITEENVVVSIYQLSKLTEEERASIFLSRTGELAYAILEKVWAFHGQGVTSAFSFGDAFGSLRTLCIASLTPFELLSPAKWQKTVGLRTTEYKNAPSQTTKKKLGLKLAQQLFPNTKGLNKETADSLLLAYTAKLRFVKETNVAPDLTSDNGSIVPA